MVVILICLTRRPHLRNELGIQKDLDGIVSIEHMILECKFYVRNMNANLGSVSGRRCFFRSHKPLWSVRHQAIEQFRWLIDLKPIYD